MVAIPYLAPLRPQAVAEAAVFSRDRLLAQMVVLAAVETAKRQTTPLVLEIRRQLLRLKEITAALALAALRLLALVAAVVVLAAQERLQPLRVLREMAVSQPLPALAVHQLTTLAVAVVEMKFRELPV
jgi:hypothetical protein